MPTDRFEILHKDVMGRIGRLYTPHGIVETPMLMPVVNPNIDFISASEMKKFGAEILMTNSYIIYRTPLLREIAMEKGVHGLLNVDMPVMTDSGSYQLMIYGDLEIDNQTIVKFQHDIESDIVVPLDIPTPPDADYNTALNDLRTTLQRENEAIAIHREHSQALIAAPIQGSTHLELRKFSASEVVKLEADVYPIGAVVPLLDSYRFSDVIRILIEVKSILPSWAPLHLFGAGHPMFFAIAVALGCDLFDSAAYALYAKDDRYLTNYGTKKLGELRYFPCSCPICSKYTPEELEKIDKEERELLIAKHNLWVSFQEIRTIKQAIRENTLFELVEERIRNHPNLVAAWRQMIGYKKILEIYDPSMKHIFFYTGIESVYRPAVLRHHERILQIELEDKDEFVISTEDNLQADFYLKPVFGIVPSGMLEVYPAGHAEMLAVDIVEEEAIKIAIEALIKFLKQHSKRRFRILARGRWREFLKDLPENTVVQ
jgi:7-cyano-7-deazaguanine tRNA-ribosyltransferase